MSDRLCIVVHCPSVVRPRSERRCGVCAVCQLSCAVCQLSRRVFEGMLCRRVHVRCVGHSFQPWINEKRIPIPKLSVTLLHLSLDRRTRTTGEWCVVTT